MNWTAVRDPSIVSNVPAPPSGHDSHTLIEETACAIAQAQAALFTGRIQDLEKCISRQQELCAALKALQENI